MPIYPKKEIYVEYPGKFFTAEWYYTTNGEMPGRDYYENLSKPDQVRLDQIIKYLCDSPFGTFLPISLYRIEDRLNKIYAFKSRDERFFNFMTEGARVIITNAYQKHSQQMARIDLESLKTAVAYKHDYLIV